jgi:hypothetical protein
MVFYFINYIFQNGLSKTNVCGNSWAVNGMHGNIITSNKQIWNSSIETSSKGGNYKLFKGELKFENYLDILEDKDKFTLCVIHN